jgi:hypothetical protein
MVIGIAKTCRSMPELKDKMAEMYGKVLVRYTVFARTGGANIVRPRHAAALSLVGRYLL